MNYPRLVERCIRTWICNYNEVFISLQTVVQSFVIPIPKWWWMKVFVAMNVVMPRNGWKWRCLVRMLTFATRITKLSWRTIPAFPKPPGCFPKRIWNTAWNGLSHEAGCLKITRGKLSRWTSHLIWYPWMMVTSMRRAMRIYISLIIFSRRSSESLKCMETATGMTVDPEK